MDLISKNLSWNTLNSQIKERAKNIEKSDYFSIKNKLLDCNAGSIIYFDDFTPKKDDMSFLFASNNQYQTLVFLNSFETIGGSSGGELRQGISLKLNWRVIFKIPIDLLDTNLNFSMSHIGLTEGNIVVPIGTKQAYINRFDVLGQSDDTWRNLTQAEKEAIVVEGDEYEIIG